MTEVAERGAFGAKKLVLGFDAGCMTCSELARKIEEEVGDKLEVRSLHDPQMVHWREQALGEDAPWAPTLVKLEGAEVKAWTGLKMGIALSRHLGAVSTWRVMQLIGDIDSLQKTSVVPSSGLSRGQFLKDVGGAAAAVSILAGTGGIASVAEAVENPKLSTGTPGLRKKAKAIVRSSRQYRKLVREIGQTFDFRNAKFAFDKTLKIMAVSVSAPATKNSAGSIAIFFAELPDEVISHYQHATSTKNGNGKYTVKVYADGKSLGGGTVTEDYVIAPGGQKLSYDRFQQEAQRRVKTSGSEEAVFTAQGRCSRCRRRRRNRCNFVVNVLGCGIFFRGPICSFILWYNGTKGAGCAAWARSTCYEDGFCG